MRRVLFLITDLELGGTPIVVRELATRLRSAELEIEVACLKPMGIVGQQLLERGVRVTSFDAWHPFEVMHVARKLARLVKERQINLVVSFLFHANYVASVSRGWWDKDVRLFQSIQTTQPRPRWHWWLQRTIAKSADLFIVPSPSIARRMETWSDRRGWIAVIPNAVDLEHFRTTATTSTGGSQPRRVGFIGRLDPVKRVPDLLEAIASLPSTYRLNVYGDGVMRSKLERLIVKSNLSGRVQLHGQVTDVPGAFGTIDLLVLPSDAEGFGLVLIEAMAAGVPVIGTNVDGIRDVIRAGETGLLVPPRNPAALAAAIQRLAEDAQLRERLIDNARRDVEARFSWPPVLAQYRSLLLS